MGWLAWERFRCNTDCVNFPYDCIGEKLFMDMADRLSEDGWREHGYKYVNIDDCWMAKERNKDGQLYGDLERFPSGIKSLADYVHSRELKLGIYEDYGVKTCAGYPGSQGYEEVDANTFASWGVDMLKFDGCNSNDSSKAVGYPLMSKSLNETGRPIMYSCSWPDYEGGVPPKVNYTEVGEICNLWRNTADIDDSWDSVIRIVDWYAKNQDALVPAAGPGHWNDPDMLIVGDFSLSIAQSRAQMGMWAMMAAPLFMSNDLRKISPEAVEILQNKLVIAIDQDRAGIQGKRYINAGSIQAWSRPLTEGRHAVALLNTGIYGTPSRFTFTLQQLNINSRDVRYELYDVFDHREEGRYTVEEKVTTEVDPTGIKMFLVIPISRRSFFQVLLGDAFGFL